MGLVGKNFAWPSAASCFQKQIQRAWIASSISSKFFFPSVGAFVPSELLHIIGSITIQANANPCNPNNRGMQDCFRQHPDIYGSELEDDDDFEGYEGDNEPRSPDFDDSASSSRPSASDTALAPRQGDQTSEKPTSSPKSARLNPEVDEPSIYPPTPPVPFQSSSDASQPASPNEQISEDKNQQLALKTLHDANASQAATPNERGSEDEKKQLASKPSHDANQITLEN